MAARYLTHVRQTSNDGKKTRYEVQEFVAEYETDGSKYEIYYHDLELWYRDKIKGTVRPEELNLDEALQEAFYKVRTGGDF